MYPILWSVLLVSDSRPDPDEWLGDFIKALRRSSCVCEQGLRKKPFMNVEHGGYECAQALKREAEARLVPIRPYEERFTQTQRFQQHYQRATFSEFYTHGAAE